LLERLTAGEKQRSKQEDQKIGGGKRIGGSGTAKPRPEGLLCRDFNDVDGRGGESEKAIQSSGRFTTPGSRTFAWEIPLHPERKGDRNRKKVGGGGGMGFEGIETCEGLL